MSLPGETFPFPEHLQELPAQGWTGKQHSHHGPAAAQEAQKCRGGHNVGLKYGLQVGLSPPWAGTGHSDWRLHCLLGGIAQQLALSFHRTQKSPCTRSIMRCNSTTAAKCTYSTHIFQRDARHLTTHCCAKERFSVVNILGKITNFISNVLKQREEDIHKKFVSVYCLG